MFVLSGVQSSQAEDASQRIARFQELRLEYQQQFAADRNREKLEAMVDYLISSPITSISQAHESLNIGSFTTVQRHIEKLKILGIVREVTGNKRNRIYHAAEILKVLEKRI